MAITIFTNDFGNFRRQQEYMMEKMMHIFCLFFLSFCIWSLLITHWKREKKKTKKTRNKEKKKKRERKVMQCMDWGKKCKQTLSFSKWYEIVAVVCDLQFINFLFSEWFTNYREKMGLLLLWFTYAYWELRNCISIKKFQTSW